MKTIPVKCMVRVRPLSKKEIDEGAASCMIAVDKTIAARENQFTYDYVFPQAVDQIEVFAKTVEPMLVRLFDGYNQTVFAYGQTGSGKTFTMGGEYGKQIDADIEGIIPRVANRVFESIDELKGSYAVSARVSYFELYKEDIRDLLKPDTDVKLLQVRETPDGQTTVSELSDRIVTNRQDLLEQLKEGNKYRTTGATNMNATSSRSHAVFTIRIEQQSSSDPEDTKCSSLHLIDLAGSERLKKTGAEGKRKEEGVQINLGLLALGNVISSLSDNLQHIPYRDSKLTRILKDSLGGNSHTLMIACVSPADTNFEESLNTLRYADRARKIKNKPIINRDPVQAELIQLRKELQIMRANGGGGGVPMDIEETEEYQDMKETLNKQIEDYRNALTASSNKAQNLLIQIDRGEKAHVITQQKLGDIKNRASELKETHTDMTLVGEQLEDLEMDENAVTVFKSLRSLQDMILELESHNKHRRISFARTAPTAIGQDRQLDEITEMSEDEDGSVNGSLGMSDSRQLFDAPLNTHKINEDIFDIENEIETKEEHIKKLLDQEENPHLIRAQYERQINTMSEQISKLENEKGQLLAAKSNVVKDKKSKVEDSKRKRLGDLEKEIANLKKDKLAKERLARENKDKEKFIIKMKTDLAELKRKKVDLVKKAKQDQKKFAKIKLEKDREIKTLQKSDRRQKCDIEKMARQNERVQNVLRIKTEQMASAEKKLTAMMTKRSEVAAQKIRAGSGKVGLVQHKETLMNELHVKVSAGEAKNALDHIKTHRSNMTKQMKAAPEGKSKERLKRNIDRKTAEIALLQRKVSESESYENPVSSKKLPLKDLGEARKMIEFLFDQLAEKATTANLNELRSNDAEEQVRKLKTELDLIRQQNLGMVDSHREELTEFRHELTSGHQLEINSLNETVSRQVLKIKKLKSKAEVKKEAVEEQVLDAKPAVPERMPKPKMGQVKTKKGIKSAKGKGLTEPEVIELFEDTPSKAPETPIHKLKDPLYDPVEDQQRANRRTTTNKRPSNETTLVEEAVDKKRQSRSRCGCKGNCQRMICSCRKSGQKCDPSVCKCNSANCVNVDRHDDDDDDDMDYKENETVLIDPIRSKLNSANPRSPRGELDVSTMGLGNVNAFTPSRERLFNGSKNSRATRRLPYPKNEPTVEFNTPKRK